MPQPAMSTWRVWAGGVMLLASAVIYFVCEAIAAAAWHHPSYSYAHNYISDLGVPGPPSVLMGRVIDSPLAGVMNVGGFIGHGVLFAVAALLLVPLLAPLAPGRWRVVVIVLAVLHAVGIVMVGVVHGSASSIAHGLFVYHSTGANLAIFGGNILSIVIGALAVQLGAPRWFGVISIVLGALGFVSLGLLALRTSVPDGIFERGAVYSIFAWELFAGIVLLAGGPPRVSDPQARRPSVPAAAGAEQGLP
jgi:hypothetical membrane protein